MRNMSFALTTPQMRARTKTVTRRLGWSFLKPGDRVQAVVKGMGLKKGEKVERICVIEVVSTRAEFLCRITDEDVVAEGFPGMTRVQFMEMFAAANGCVTYTPVNRIEFKYVD
jgi:hypothetical protein